MSNNKVISLENREYIPEVFILRNPLGGKIRKGSNWNAFNRESLGSIPRRTENILFKDKFNHNKLGFNSQSIRFSDNNNNNIVNNSTNQGNNHNNQNSNNHNISHMNNSNMEASTYNNTIASSNKSPSFSSKGYGSLASSSERFGSDYNEALRRYLPGPSDYKDKTGKMATEASKSISYKSIYKESKSLQISSKYDKTPGPGFYSVSKNFIDVEHHNYKRNFQDPVGLPMHEKKFHYPGPGAYFKECVENKTSNMPGNSSNPSNSMNTFITENNINALNTSSNNTNPTNNTKSNNLNLNLLTNSNNNNLIPNTSTNPNQLSTKKNLLKFKQNQDLKHVLNLDSHICYNIPGPGKYNLFQTTQDRIYKHSINNIKRHNNEIKYHMLNNSTGINDNNGLKNSNTNNTTSTLSLLNLHANNKASREALLVKKEELRKQEDEIYRNIVKSKQKQSSFFMSKSPKLEEKDKAKNPGPSYYNPLLIPSHLSFNVANTGESSNVGKSVSNNNIDGSSSNDKNKKLWVS